MKADLSNFTAASFAFDDAIKTLARLEMAQTEAALSACIQNLEGRMPSPAEIAEHGQKMIFPDGTEEWKWRDNLILRVHPMATDERGVLACIMDISTLCLP